MLCAAWVAVYAVQFSVGLGRGEAPQISDFAGLTEFSLGCEIARECIKILIFLASLEMVFSILRILVEGWKGTVFFLMLTLGLWFSPLRPDPIGLLNSIQDFQIQSGANELSTSGESPIAEDARKSPDYALLQKRFDEQAHSEGSFKIGRWIDADDCEKNAVMVFIVDIRKKTYFADVSRSISRRAIHVYPKQDTPETTPPQ